MIQKVKFDLAQRVADLEQESLHRRMMQHPRSKFIMRIQQYAIGEKPVDYGERDPFASECQDTFEVKMDNKTQVKRGDVAVTDKQVEL